MMIGKGTPKAKIATKAPAATASSVRLLQRSAMPIRTSACRTMARTAALRPKKAAATMPTSPKSDVDPAQRHDRDDAGQDEEDAGDEPAAGAVQQPADVGRELLRLRPGQQHAEVERMQEAPVAEPAPLLDEDAVHDRDLPGRAAEGQERDPEPTPASPRRGSDSARPAARSSRRPRRPGGAASCGSRGSRRGPSGRRRRRAPCRPRAARGRRRTCARARATRRAGPPPRARGRAARCPRRGRSSRAGRAPGSPGRTPRPSRRRCSARPRWLQKTPSMSIGHRAEAAPRRRHLGRRDEEEDGAGVDEAADQPRAGDAVDLRPRARDPDAAAERRRAR